MTEKTAAQRPKLGAPPELWSSLIRSAAARVRTTTAQSPNPGGGGRAPVDRAEVAVGGFESKEKPSTRCAGLPGRGTGLRHRHREGESTSKSSEPFTRPVAFGDEAVTMPFAVPIEATRAGTGHELRAAHITQSSARAVATAFRGADLLGLAVSAGGRGVRSQVRTQVASRWPSRPPATHLPSTPPAGSTGPRVPWLPVTALLACAAGIVGLLLPLVELGGLASLALIDIPYLGVPLLGLFLLLSALPLLDVWQRRVRWTAWLLVPALLGALPVALVVFAMPWLPRALHLLWATAPEEMLGAGAASVTLGGTDAALIVLAASALLLRLRNRLLRRRVLQPSGPRR